MRTACSSSRLGGSPPGTPLEQTLPRPGTPQEQTPLGADPPPARHAEILPAMHAGIAHPPQGMLGYHLQCMLG